MDRRRVALAGAAFVALVATVYAANWLIEHVGVVEVGFGYQAPAAVYAAGLAFVARDLLHEWGGRWAVLAAILVGAGASYTVSPAFATASAAAFLASELVDWAVYEPLRRRRWWLAVAGSNVAGLVVDSVLFLWLAFGSLAFLPGQVIGKAWMTVAALAVLALVHRRVFRAPAIA
jgi:hypothetical protein